MRVTDLRISWRNLGRNRKRTALALLAISVGQFALLATDGLMRGYADQIRLAITGPMVGHVQVHHPRWREEGAMELALEDVDGLRAVIGSEPAVRDVAARIYAPVLAAPEEDAYTAMVVGVDLDVEAGDYGMLSGLDALPGSREVLVGYRLARKMQARLGQEIAVVGQAVDGSIASELYTIRGIIRSPADIVNQSGLVMSLADAQELLVMEGRAHEIVIRAHTSDEARGLAGRLASRAELEGCEVQSWRDIVPELVIVIDMADWVGYLVVVLVFIAALAGIANTLMTSTFERLREFGVLLALGCRPLALVRMIFLEGLLLGVLGAALGTLLGGVFVAIYSRIGVDFASWGGNGEAADMAFKGLNIPLHVFPRLEPHDPLVGLAAVLVTALIASAWPAWLAARLEPMEAMRG